jgi:SWI/SNF-related matrix-associated actin-dependent regulator of chromatin subfamily A member 5
MSSSESAEDRPARAVGRVRGRGAGDAALLAESNAAVDKALSDGAAGRTNYLLSQAPLFRKFMGLEGEDAGGKGQKDGRRDKVEASPGTKRRRMTELEEDRLLVADDGVVLAQTTRLPEQPANVTGKMRPYQVEGLNFLIGLFERGINGILADEMGLGKTLQTISLLAFLRLYKGINGPHIVIVPKSTLGNWMNELKRWCPDIHAVRFHGNAEERKEQCESLLQIGEFDVCVTTYETVTKEKAHLTKFHWRCLIIDEAHRIKNENSQLAQVVRLFKTQSRLLITGTPLQNNLHELWALLNFLLPDIFNSSDDFERWFSSVEDLPGAEGNAGGGEGGKKADEGRGEIVKQLHAILRPFLIRRLKSEVEHSLPPKKETVLFTKLSPMQLNLYKDLLKKDIDAINGKGGDRVRLLNILMQLRKCCNHPYLFDGVEDRTLDPFGDHVVTNCGKLALLDRLLPRLQRGGHRVLIFSQMTRVLDILEDYATMRNYGFCRIDGSTDGELRDSQIVDYNAEGSDKFIFLLSTRAGGLGINLATADTVLLYDSDWNAQVDLQAMDRAHRIGQKKQVNVYRLITESSVEERVLRTAMAKLRLDTLVIQQGRLTQQKKNLEKNELLDMIRFGADKFFKSHSDEYRDEDLDVILQRGHDRTAEMNKDIEAKVGAGGNLDVLDFTITNEAGEGPKAGTIFDFQGQNYKELAGGGKEFYHLDVGKRSRNQSYNESAYYREAMRVGNAPAAKQRLKYRREPVTHDFMFFDVARLREIVAAERQAVDDFNKATEAAVKADKAPPELPSKGALLSDEMEADRARILAAGFSNWTRREFNSFLRGVERHGRDNIEAIAGDIGDTKTLDEVHEYSDAFWKLGEQHLESWSRVLKSIEDGEARIQRRQEMERALALKVGRYKDPWKELDVVYSGSRSKTFIDDEDRWLVCMTNQLGYGRFEILKAEVRKAWQFRFNWWIKSRTPNELKRRIDSLIKLIEKENADIAEAERAEKRRKAAAKRRREGGGTGGASGSGAKPAKKRRGDGGGKAQQQKVDSFFKRA